MNKALTALGAMLLLSSCGSAEGEDERYDAAYENAQDEASDLTFEDVGSTAACTQDCSGHDAGFEWAKEHGIADASECGGTSDSFIEGCEAYADAVESDAEDELAD